jgi:CBS domain-containing protein
MRLTEIMSTAVETTTRDASSDVAFSRMQDQDIHHLVVMDGGRVVGVLSHRDLGGRGGASVRRNRTVGELMTTPVVTAAPDTTVRQAANLLRGRLIGCLPVLKGKKLAGIVTVSDLLELLGRGALRPSPTGKRPTLTRTSPRWKGKAPNRAAARRRAR